MRSLYVLSQSLVWIYICFVSSDFVSAQTVNNELTENLKSIILQVTEEQNIQLLKDLESAQTVLGQAADFCQEDVVIARRLNGIENIIPLNYNASVRAYIQTFTSSNYKPYIGKLLARSKFYFPIYDQIFKEKNLPEEIRYISVIESSLNPYLVSRSGAVGPWQFMYATAKYHNLTINKEVDERRDPFLSSYAVTDYLQGAYEEFDDWLLTLASYNCGRGCVRRAIAKSGIEKPTFWQLSAYLPKETQNYIPKFIAMAYVFQYADAYDIPKVQSDLNLEYEIVSTNKSLNMQLLSKVTGFPLLTLQKLNPSYKNVFIQGNEVHSNRLLIPKSDATNDSLLYLVLQGRLPFNYQSLDDIDIHCVEEGETLQLVAEKYKVTEKQLLAWNDVDTDVNIVGKFLFVKNLESGVTLAKNKHTPVKGKQQQSRVITYTVKKGDTLSGIASRYKGVSVAKLRSDNNLKGSHLSIGKKLRIAMQ